MNIGPTADGRIIPLFEERLRDVGAWLGVNGDAIYASRPWTHQNDTMTPNVWYTMKKQASGDTTVYAIVLKWPSGGVLKLGAVNPGAQGSVSMLGVPGALKWSKGASGGVVVQMPMLPPSTSLRWAWTLAFNGVM